MQICSTMQCQINQICSINKYNNDEVKLTIKSNFKARTVVAEHYNQLK